MRHNIISSNDLLEAATEKDMIAVDMLSLTGLINGVLSDDGIVEKFLGSW